MKRKVHGNCFHFLKRHLCAKNDVLKKLFVSQYYCLIKNVKYLESNYLILRVNRGTYSWLKNYLFEFYQRS